jgi:hypothetical protein
MPMNTVRTIASVLACYFYMPSRQGFSAYRTGWIGHLAFSAAVAGGIVYLGWRTLGWNAWTGLCLGLASVWALWGVGIVVGVFSHYGLFPLLFAMAVVFVGPYLSACLAVGVIVAIVGHVTMAGFARTLRWVAGPENRERA